MPYPTFTVDDLEQASACYQAGLRGDFRLMASTREALGETTDPVTRAWSMALAGLEAFANPARGRLPTIREVSALRAAPAQAQRLAARTCALVERWHFLNLDRDALADWLALHAELTEGSDGWLAIGQSWHAIATGDSAAASEAASRAATEARALKDEAMTLEAASLGALAAVEEEASASAVRAARVASRMARTEALPQHEHLANLVLARLRRESGKPHLATRILSSLLRVASPPWHGWMSWELLLAGGLQDTRGLTRSGGGKMGDALKALTSLLAAAAAGDNGAFHAEARWLREHTEGWLERDVHLVCCVLGDTHHPSDHEPAAAWVSGQRDAIPAGLHGLNPVDLATGSRGSREAAYVLATPGRPPRRILRAGVPLLRSVVRPQPLAPAKGRQARTESAIAALALAGPAGIDPKTLFEQLYGFAYEAEVHQGVRDVLFHRVRARLGEAATLEHHGPRLRLKIETPLLLPDPRCSPPQDYEVLRLLARHQQMSAKEAARTLGIPTRTAQDALRRLVDEGACRADRRGRGFAYSVEDTTFQEPTLY